MAETDPCTQDVWKVRVQGFDRHTEQEALTNHFSIFGDVISVDLYRRKKSVAFLGYRSLEEAVNVVTHLHGSMVVGQDCSMVVRLVEDDVREKVTEKHDLEGESENPQHPMLPNSRGVRERYEKLAFRYPPWDVRRYSWGKYTASGMRDTYAEVARLIPEGVTSVLDVGCGSGELADVLRSVRPELRYRGLDIAPSNVEAAKARLGSRDSYDFSCDDFWSFLLAPAQIASWDFVVSVGCIFSHCLDTKTTQEMQLRLLDAIDAASPRGFLLICHGADSGHGICMDAARERVETYLARRSDGQGLCLHYVSSPDGLDKRPRPYFKKIGRANRLIMLLN